MNMPMKKRIGLIKMFIDPIKKLFGSILMTNSLLKQTYFFSVLVGKTIFWVTFASATGLCPISTGNTYNHELGHHLVQKAVSPNSASYTFSIPKKSSHYLFCGVLTQFAACWAAASCGWNPN